MKTILKQTTLRGAVVERQYSYQELIAFLDAHWSEELKDRSLSCVKILDKACGSPSQRINTILVTGTNGKSLTTHFIARLLRQEGLAVGAFYSPHVLSYTERIACNGETISQKLFTDIGNEVVQAAQELKLNPHALDVMVVMALLYFEKQKADMAVLEIPDGTDGNPVLLCKPKIVALTRIAVAENGVHADTVEGMLSRALSLVGPHVHVVSADQSRSNLQIMEKITRERNGIWNMPVRKLAPLPYPFEQLHGRSAALAERVSQLYINSFLQGVAVSTSLLAKQKGQRGRPKREMKQQLELHPKRTLAQFWKESPSSLIGRFQLFDKEKPAVLIDNATNNDALQNLLLGIRLLHYQRIMKGFVLLLEIDRERLASSEFGWQLRYFFKKMSGNVVICPTIQGRGAHRRVVGEADLIANDLKGMKIKARAAKNFKEAFELARELVDERDGFIAIAGSAEFIAEYWQYKGVKAL